MSKKKVVLLVCSIISVFAIGIALKFLDRTAERYNKTLTDLEKTTQYSSDEVIKRINQHQGLFGQQDTNQFGVVNMDNPFINNGVLNGSTDRAYGLLSKIGVDSIKSGAADWHRIGDNAGGFTQLSELNYQLAEIKKYHFKVTFLIGYPPRKYSRFPQSIRSAIAPAYINHFKSYLDFIITYLKPYQVEYLELANEVDASDHWWLHSTPGMYVDEMKLLKEALIKQYSPIQTMAFSSTYSRDNSPQKPHTGREFIDESFAAGIDKYSDSYSLHHFTFPKDDGLVTFMQSTLRKNKIVKPLIDSEQMDITDEALFRSAPDTIIKIFARGFYINNLPHIDYFMARDGLVEPYTYPEGYTQGLFDMRWQAKPRLLAYAMAVDAMKNRALVTHAIDDNGVEFYQLKDTTGKAAYPYATVIWQNSREKQQQRRLRLNQGQLLERWDLSQQTSSSSYVLGSEPVAVFSKQPFNQAQIGAL